MQPLFKELFIQTDAEDLPAEDRRRRVRRSRQARPAMASPPWPDWYGCQQAARWPSQPLAGRVDAADLAAA